MALRLAIAVPVAALAAVLVLRPWIGLLAWLAAMPLLNAAHVQVVLGAWQLLLATPLCAALFLGWLLSRSGLPAGQPRFRGIAMDGWAWGIGLAIVVLVGASTAMTADVSRAIPIALHGVVEPVLLGCLAIALRPTRGQVVALAGAIGLGLVVATLVNLARMVYLVRLTGDWVSERGELARLTYYNVGVYGDLLVMALPLVIALALSWHTLRPRDRDRGRGRDRGGLAWAACAVLLAVAVYPTFSKSAWIGALAVIAALALLVPRTWRVRAAALAAMVLVSGALLPWPSMMLRPVAPAAADAYEQLVDVLQPRSASINTGTSQGEVSVTERLRASVAGLKMAIDHPLLGVGPGGFGPAYAGEYRDPEATRELGHPHNFVVTLLSELGFVVTALIGLAFLAAALAALALWRRGDRVERLMGAGFVTALGGFLLVATLFGLDLYGANRLMNSDVLVAALIVAMPLAMWADRRRRSVVA